MIALNASEPNGRQRFSLAHEFCHVLHHATRGWLYAEADEHRAERIADWFAGCLLAPKRHVKRLRGERCTSAAMARAFGISAQAMNVRLLQLGLADPTPRCDWSSRRKARTYYRAHPVPMEVAA